MPTRIQSLRHKAYLRQAGCCWYCGAPMWLRSPGEFPDAPSAKAAALLACTAEHLLARCDGGRDIESNIVAACLLCNRTRHRKKCPPPPTVYRTEVWRRMLRGA